MNRLIPPHGGYRELKSFQHSELVYDSTVKFCDCFIDRRSRTHDQMVQAARSGRQNIAEGSQASGTSRKFELKLVGVAPASKNCSWITRIFCGNAGWHCGGRTTRQRKLCVAWPIKKIDPIRPIGPILNHRHRNWLQTPSSA